jgi:hypothetical protein
MAQPTLTRDQVAERLARHADERRSLGVRSLDLFGSTARGEARPESDVDLPEGIRNRTPDVGCRQVNVDRGFITELLRTPTYCCGAPPAIDYPAAPFP